jgi:hypothetical protein
VRSHRTKSFRKCYDRLPPDIQRKADKAFRLWKQNPSHPSLQFKQVHATQPIYSARVDFGYRAVGIKRDDVMIWFWIGEHDEYERIIASYSSCS